jgi:putative redox protein
VSRMAQTPSVPDDTTLRFIDLTKIGDGRYKATNRRGGVLPIGSGDDPDFSPIELLLAAIAGCSAIDVDLITGKRVAATSFDVHTEGHKIRDEKGTRMIDLRVSVDITWPEGADGDRAREMLPSALRQVRDRLCTVARTVQLGEPIAYDGADH